MKVFLFCFCFFGFSVFCFWFLAEGRGRAQQRVAERRVRLHLAGRHQAGREVALEVLPQRRPACGGSKR